MVERPLWLDSLEASLAILSKMSLTKEFMMLMALLEIRDELEGGLGGVEPPKPF